MENLEGGKKDQNFLKINNKVKKIKNLVLFIFICLSLFFMGRFVYVMYDEKVNLDNEIENSLSLAEKKLDMYLKTFKWEEIDEKKINYNTIFQNYLMYKPKTNINQNYTIYKLPYVREKFSSIINNGIIISKENERNNKKLERILSKELSTLNEIEKILENENLKNTRIVAVNNDYRMIFSKEVLDELKEKYYS